MHILVCILVPMLDCLSCFLLCFDLDQFVGQFIAVLGTAAAFNGSVVINHLAAATPRPCICTYCRQTLKKVPSRWQCRLFPVMLGKRVSVFTKTISCLAVHPKL